MGWAQLIAGILQLAGQGMQAIGASKQQKTQQAAAAIQPKQQVQAAQVGGNTKASAQVLPSDASSYLNMLAAQPNGWTSAGGIVGSAGQGMSSVLNKDPNAAVSATKNEVNALSGGGTANKTESALNASSANSAGVSPAVATTPTASPIDSYKYPYLYGYHY